MKARTDTREKILELGTDLVKSIGYPSLSYQQISSKLGIKNAAVHYHFPGKEDLGRGIFTREQDYFDGLAAGLSEQSSLEKLEGFLVSYRRHLDEDNKICLIGASASDYHELPSSMQEACKDYFVTIKSWFTDVLESGRKNGEFYFRGEAVNKASVFVSALAGALQHARLVGNDYYEDVVNQLLDDLKP